MDRQALREKLLDPTHYSSSQEWFETFRKGFQGPLDAAADGVDGMHIVPVGVTFEDKVALRSRVVVRAGTPIDPTMSSGVLNTWSAPGCTKLPTRTVAAISSATSC